MDVEELEQRCAMPDHAGDKSGAAKHRRQLRGMQNKAADAAYAAAQVSQRVTIAHYVQEFAETGAR
eukprot:9486720-Pyramimonas_sp.AAC.1